MLFLFTDVGLDDAPTRIVAGSHLDVPPVLEPIGDAGMHFDRVVPMIPHYKIAKSRSQRVRPATFIYAIPSLCTPPPGRIGAPDHASFPSPSFRRQCH